MGDQNNRELLQYFKNRNAWLLEPDESPPKLSAYPGILDRESPKSQQGAGTVDSAISP
jgi:hypothetical protein